MNLLNQFLGIFRKDRSKSPGGGIEIAPGLMVNHPANYQPVGFPQTHSIAGYDFTQRGLDEFVVSLPYPNPHFVAQEIAFRLSSTQTVEERHLRLLGEIHGDLETVMERFVEEIVKYENLSDPGEIRAHAGAPEIVYEDLEEDEEGLEEWHVCVEWDFKSIFMEMKGLEVADVWAGS